MGGIGQAPEESSGDWGKFFEEIQGVFLDLWSRGDRAEGQAWWGDLPNWRAENANLKFEVAALHEHMDKVKEEAIEKFQVSQPYFNEMMGCYRDGFEDFHKQAVLLFPDLDFSQIQIKLNALMTLTGEPVPDDEEIDNEVMMTNGPAGVADEPKDPDE